MPQMAVVHQRLVRRLYGDVKTASIGKEKPHHTAIV